MSVDKLVDSTLLDSDLTSVANAIRTKGGTSDPLFFPDEFITAIMAIQTAVKRTYTGSVVNFNMEHSIIIEAQIEPMQSGSGDPSPSNVRPISGWSEATLTRTGKNLLYCESATSSTAAMVTFTNNHDGTWTLDGTATAFAGKHISAGAPLKLKAGVTYHISGGVTGLCNAYLYKNGTLKTDSGSGANYTPSTDISGVQFYISMAKGKTADNLIVRPMLTIDGSGTEFERYNATIYTVDLDGTCYGGTLDVLTGVLTVTKANIASYAGETLPGEWISDRDVYAPETTPTLGAQVVYDLETPQTVQLTPTQVALIVGENNIWADTGDVTVEYTEIRT